MPRVRVADYIAETLAQHGIRHVFLVTGGGAMHLDDAIGRCKDLEYIACHHEQACAMAAQGYYRTAGRLAAVCVTSGPGGTNALTGVWGAWVDSLGMVVVSGQVKFETVVRSTSLPLRQLGDQEIDIAKLVAPITKYAVMVTDPETVRYHLERALHLADSGRPGPVWLDVPLDVQAASVDPAALAAYDPREDEMPILRGAALDDACGQALARLAAAKRPVIMPGSGVRLARATEDFLALVERLGVPCVTAFNAHDLMPEDHPLYAGRPGTVGDRPGNFAVQNADFLLVLGCRLNIRQIGYGWKTFARAAYKVMIDVDAAELAKPTLRIDLPIHADLRDAMRAMARLAPASVPVPAHAEYLAWCCARRARYDVVLPGYWTSTSAVNPYCFARTVWKRLGPGAVVVTGDATACVVTFQTALVKPGQRLFSDSGCAPMGFDLPAAVGASIALGRRPVVCFAGDGSIQLNVQELQTVVTQALPIKIFLLNNRGYHSIRQTQAAYFPDNKVGAGPESGVGFPDFSKLAWAYGIPYRRVGTHAEMDGAIAEVLAGDGPQMCEVMLDTEQPFAPKVASRRLPDGRMVSPPLEDLAPFLPRDELLQNLLIPPVAED